MVSDENEMTSAILKESEPHLTEKLFWKIQSTLPHIATLDPEKTRLMAQLKLGKTMHDYFESCPTIKVLSFDGGGVRGYLSILVLEALLSNLGVTQRDFVKQFDYIVGTSTGALIAFALVANIPIAQLKDMYEKANEFFVPASFFVMDPAFKPDAIHAKIDALVKQSFAAKDHEAVTFGDLQTLTQTTFGKTIRLVVNTIDITNHRTMSFDSGNRNHNRNVVSDVLKATMAAPSYFPPHKMKVYHRKTSNDCVMIDGGLFANDPMLVGLILASVNSLKHSRIVGLGIGTGICPPKLWGEFSGPPLLLAAKGLFDVIFDAQRDFIEKACTQLARLSNFRRFKFNVKFPSPVFLDDIKFPSKLAKPENKSAFLSCDDFHAMVKFTKSHILPAAPAAVAQAKLPAETLQVLSNYGQQLKAKL